MSGQVRPSIQTRMDALLETRTTRRSQRTSPPRTAHAPLLKSSSGIPGDVPHPRRQAARKRPDIAATVGGARRASPPQTIHGPASAVRSRLEESELRSCSDQNPRRTERRRTRLIRSRRRRAYDIAGLPPDPPGGDAASRARPLPRSRPRRSRRRPAARENHFLCNHAAASRQKGEAEILRTARPVQEIFREFRRLNRRLIGSSSLR